MGYTVDLEFSSLHAHNEAAARRAVAIMTGDLWVRSHIRASVSARTSPFSDEGWFIVFDNYDGCYWHEPSARAIWLAIAPCLRDNSVLEFREEGGRRYRIRWEAGRVYEEVPSTVIWEVDFEITAALLAE